MVRGCVVPFILNGVKISKKMDGNSFKQAIDDGFILNFIIILLNSSEKEYVFHVTTEDSEFNILVYE